MKILFYFGHPAQYLFSRATIKRFMVNGEHQIIILIKTKDVLENLLKNDNLPYINILPKERGSSRLMIGLSLLKRNLKILPLLLKNRPDLLIGTDASIAQLGWLLGINRITITEDDYDVIKSLADLTYPFTKTILCPQVCNVGKWFDKKIGYNAYMKLGYLHPKVFSANTAIRSKYRFSQKYVIIRLSKLKAHHDFGVKGINDELLDKLIPIIEQNGFQVLLSCEGEVSEKNKQYLLHIDPNDMHHVLANASFLICDSQSMSVEASMLGIPSLRYSSFSGRISVLEELEQKYHLSFGIPIGNEKLLISKLEEFLSDENLNEDFQIRREKMLRDKINITEFLFWFIENYPESAKTMKENPDYQHNFR
jgi:uncharacterized protein